MACGIVIQYNIKTAHLCLCKYVDVFPPLHAAQRKAFPSITPYCVFHNPPVTSCAKKNYNTLGVGARISGFGMGGGCNFSTVKVKVDPAPDAFKVGRRFFLNKPVKSSQLMFEKKRWPSLLFRGALCVRGGGAGRWRCGWKGAGGRGASPALGGWVPAGWPCAVAAAIGP